MRSQEVREANGLGNITFRHGRLMEDCIFEHSQTRIQVSFRELYDVVRIDSYLHIRFCTLGKVVQEHCLVGASVYKDWRLRVAGVSEDQLDESTQFPEDLFSNMSAARPPRSKIGKYDSSSF